MPFETRSGKRHQAESAAEYKLDETMSGSVKLNIPSSFIKAGLIDISSGGCALDSPYLIPPEMFLKININAAPFVEATGQQHAGAIAVAGQVRSCVMTKPGHYRLGIQFKEIKKEDLELINNFMQTRERRAQPRWDMST